MDINDRITDALALAERLIKLIDEENALLRDNETHRLAEVVEDKANLSMAFEKAYKAIKSDEENMKNADQALREDMRDVTERLDEAMKENGRLLEAAIKARQTFLNLVREAAQENAPKTGAYSATGIVDTGRTDKKTRASVAYDQSL